MPSSPRERSRATSAHCARDWRLRRHRILRAKRNAKHSRFCAAAPKTCGGKRGDAALRAAGLRQRFGLTASVPCRSTELQSRCDLLADAREAHALVPSADEQVSKIRRMLDALNADIRALEKTVAEFGDTAAAIRAAQSERANCRHSPKRDAG